MFCQETWTVCGIGAEKVNLYLRETRQYGNTYGVKDGPCPRSDAWLSATAAVVLC